MRVVGLAVLLLLGAGAVLFWSHRAAPPPSPLRFIGSAACRECHDERYGTWLQTAHAYSLRAPEEGSVEGDFHGRPVEAPYFVATPYRKGAEYWMRVEGRDMRASGDYRVDRVIGRSFEQAYLLRSPTGEWRVLPICWSIERKEWDLTHEVLSDITGHVGAIPDTYDTRNHVFNHGCGQCHATNYDVGHDPATGAYASTFLEGAVSCESCHGPGSLHAEVHRKGGGAGGELLNPARDLDARQIHESCGRCHYMHEWRYAIDADPRVGYPEISVSQNDDRPGFFADGRLAGLNYHGSTQRQSACYLKGQMSCLSCHKLHGGKPWAMRWRENDDAQCNQCHADVAGQGNAHTHHTDLRCVDCHMPRFLTGVLHFMRDHSIRSPDPALTERFGEADAPNACNTCHKTEGAAWAREWRDRWWGPAEGAMAEEVALVVALRGGAASVPTADLARVALRAESGIFFRNTAARELAARPRDPEARRAVRTLLADPDPEVVQTCCLGIGTHPHGDQAAALLPLLTHAVRTVRVEAAYALGRCGYRGATPDLERAYSDALRMLVRQRRLVATMEPIVMIAEMLGRHDEAERHFQDLLQIDPYPAGRWPRRGIDLLHASARRLTDRGLHADAMSVYARARDLSGREMPELLPIDSADSMVGAGLPDQAARNWNEVLRGWPKESPIYRIAAARLQATAGDTTGAIAALEALAAELSREPSGGKVLHRVRYAMRVVSGG